MKKSVLQTSALALFSLVLASAASATGRPDWVGVYEGTGYWRDSLGHSGNYNAQTAVTNESGRPGLTFKTIHRFSLPTGVEEENMDFAIVDTTKDFFNIEKAAGEIVGQGYCVFSQCHYSYETLGAGSSIKVEESVNFNQGKLYKLGSKMTNGQKTTWAEFLDKKTTR